MPSPLEEIQAKLYFFLDILTEWCHKGHNGSVSIVLHFQNGVLKQSFVDTHIAVPKNTVTK